MTIKLYIGGDLMKAFERYAGYKMDDSYTPISVLHFNERDACFSMNGMPLAEHCDIFDSDLMLQIVDVLKRPWNLERVDEMWISNMPGTKEIAVSLLVEKSPHNYPIYGDQAKEIVEMVNAWTA